MSNFISTIGSLILLIGVIMAVYWAFGLIRRRKTGRHTGRTALILVIVGFILTGVGGSGDSGHSAKSSNAERAALVNKKSSHKKAATPKKQVATHRSVSKQTSHSTSQQRILAKLVHYTNQESAGPNGDYYFANGKARLHGFSGMSAGAYHFSADNQGRPSTAKAVLTYSEYASSRGARQGDPLEPAGWPAENPIVAINFGLTGRTYHGYLWNRSHSIADSLLGAKSYTSANNFTTGTRSQNVGADQDGGMRAAEETVEDYWEDHPGTHQTVDYETTPVYRGTEEIPRGSIVDIKSSDGAINTEIVVLNDVEGIKINYNDASSNAKPYKRHRATQTTHRTTNYAPSTTHHATTTHQSGTATKNGQWSVAANGKVYVSQSNKYYSEVTNPSNYTYESKTAAIANGATQAVRGNQYARP